MAGVSGFRVGPPAVFMSDPAELWVSRTISLCCGGAAVTTDECPAGGAGYAAHVGRGRGRRPLSGRRGGALRGRSGSGCGRRCGRGADGGGDEVPMQHLVEALLSYE